MTAPAVLMQGRQAAERLMGDTCSIATTTRGRLGQSSLAYTVTSSVVYDGKCRVQSATQAQEAETGGQEVVHGVYVVSVPVGAADVSVGDVVTVTAAAHDPNLQGRQFTVRSVETKSNATARRLTVEERQA